MQAHALSLRDLRRILTHVALIGKSHLDRIARGPFNQLRKFTD